MKRRDFLKAAGAGIVFSSLGCLSAPRTAARKKPNIILCMADDQGWGDMGYYGHPVLKTPNFDAMAAESLRFDRFYAATPVCTPTRGSVLTGRNPNRFGCFTWGSTLRPQEVTLAETLKEQGYVTGHFGKWHLGPVYKNSPINPGASGFDEWVSSPNFFDLDPVLSDKGVAKPFTGDSSDVTVEVALDFIRRHSGSDQPFLAVVWFGSPHVPHGALEEDAALYADQPEDFKSQYGNARHFYAEITAMDRAFGKLRNELRTLDIHENTLLWYCSDNGGLPQLGVPGGREHKGSIYEGGLRVPAILEWPAQIKTPAVTNVPCTTCDIFPTLADITAARMAKEVPLDGISLVPLLDGAMKSRPVPMGFWQYPAEGTPRASIQIMSELLEAQMPGKELDDPAHLYLDADRIDKHYPDDTFPGHAAWLDWPWKLHRIQTDTATKYELYNLANDPQETRNVLGQHESQVTTMKAQLETWLKSVVNSLNGNDYQTSKRKATQ